MIKKTILMLCGISFCALSFVSACSVNPKNEGTALTVNEKVTDEKYSESIWNSKLFDESRFMLNIKLTKQEQKDAKVLAKSFNSHMENSELFLYHLLTELNNRELPLELAALPLVESGFNPRAVSHAGAKGVWQFTRQTGRSYGLKRTNNYDDFYDFIKSTDASLRYLEHLYKQFNDWDLAVVAYHQGEFGVKNKIKKAKARGVKNINANTIGLSKAAKQYLRYFHAYSKLLEKPEDFGLKHPDIANRPAFKRIEIADNIHSLEQLAHLSGANITTLKHLNAGFLTDSLKTPHHNHVLVPIENVAKLEAAINQELSKR